MNALRRTLFALVATVVVSSGLAGSAGADTINVGGFNVKALLDVATYEVHTVLRNAEGTLVDKTTPALVGVPTPVNVDKASLSAPDLTVTVLAIPLPPSIQLRIDRLTLGKLPVLVEAVFDVPGEPDGGAAFGYDGRDDTGPGSFSTTVTFAKTPSTSEIGLSLNTLRPGSELGVIAELFTPAPKGQRLDPTAARLDLEPVPNSLRANVLSDRAASRTLVELKSSVATVAAVALSDRATARERRFEATIDRLPTSVVVDVTTDATTKHDEITYQASAPIASLIATAKDVTGDTEVELSGTLAGIPAMFAITVDRPSSGPQQATWRADGRLGQMTLNGKASRAGVIERAATFTVTDLATELTVTRDGNRTSMVADSPVGAIEAGLASGGPVQLLPDPTYAYAVVKGSAFSVAARVAGLQSLSFEEGDPFVVDATITPGPLHARAVKDGTTLDAHLKNLPARARVSVSPSAGTADYNASSPIEEITVDVTSETPIVERIKEAHLLIQGVPANLHLEFGARDPAPSGVSARSTCVPTFDQPDCPDDIPGDGDGGDDGGDDDDIPPPGDFPDIDSKRSFVLDAHGATLGLAQVFLTSGPQPTRPLTDTEDGVVIEDLADRLVVFGRITGLQKAVARLRVVDERNIANFLATTARFELHRDVTAIAGRTVRAELNALQREGSGKVDRFTATLTPEKLADGTLGSLPGVTTVDLVTSFDVRPPNPTKQFLSYSASAKIGRIEAEATVADLPNPIFVGVSDVPTSFSVCRASDGRCGTEVDKPFRDGGTLHYTASSAATVDVFICFKPEQNCTNANREVFQEGLIMSNLKVPKTITFEFHKGQASGPDPTVVLVDTGDQAITGEVKLVSGVLRATARLGLPDPVGGFIGPDLQVALFGGVVRLDGVFPGGLRVDRLVLTVVDGNVKHTGGVFCPAGSLLELVVTLPGVDIDKDLKPTVCRAA